jgi:putative inorganic carbon (HCO3(-)) transporter
MGYYLFILLTVTLLIRPAEIVPALMDLPIYEVLILACLSMSVPAVVSQFRKAALVARPITACVIGLLVSVVLSHLSHFAVGEARSSGTQFLKVLLFYLLLVGVVNTAARLRGYLLILTTCIFVLTGLALLQYHGWANIPALDAYHERQDEIDEETGEIVVLARLRSTGIYNNPNDLARIVGVGILLCIYWLGDRRSGPIRFVWLIPLVIFAHAMGLTYSRGGLLGLLAGLSVLVAVRLGPARAAALSAAGLPVLLMIAGGRLAKLDTTGGTGQHRIQLWSEGYALFFRSPVFGIGMDRYVEEVGYVAHNSFVHCFTELGLLGGTFFTGCFYISLWELYRFGLRPRPKLSPRLNRVRPYLLAIVACTVIGMMSSTRSYSIPSYMILGLVAAYFRIVDDACPGAAPRLDTWMCKRIMMSSVTLFVLIHAYVRASARFS